MKISKRPGEEFTIFLKGKQLSQESHDKTDPVKKKLDQE